jgi:hypothetical protein
MRRSRAVIRGAGAMQTRPRETGILGPSGDSRRGRAMDIIRLLGFGYFLMFCAVVAIGYVPAFTDADGNLFGLFKLDLYDDSLHFFSGLWAGIAAWHSTRAATFYFKLFGTLYFLDGVMGLFLGSGYLDFGIFLYGVLDLDLATRIFANLPHLVIGGFAIFTGFVLARRVAGER